MVDKINKVKGKPNPSTGWTELDEDIKFVKGLYRIDRALGMNTVIGADSLPVRPLETGDGTGKLTPRYAAIFSADKEWAFCLHFNAEDGSRCEESRKGQNIAGFRVEPFYEDKIGPRLVQFLSERKEHTGAVWVNDVIEEVILKRLKIAAVPKFKNRMTEQEFNGALDDRDRVLQTATKALQRYAPCSCIGKMFRPEFTGEKPRDAWELRGGKAVEKDHEEAKKPMRLAKGRAEEFGEKQRDGLAVQV